MLKSGETLGFDPKRDDSSFGVMVDLFAIGLCLLLAYFVVVGLTGCGTNRFKKDCVWICPDEERIPDSCYCLSDEPSCSMK